jgi:hypothetical protein
MKYPGHETFEQDGHTYTIDKTQTMLGGHLPNVGRQIGAFRKESAYHEYEENRGEPAMPGKVDEKKWDAAKAATKKQHPDWGEDSPRFWKVVSTIYKKMGGTFHSKVEKSLAFLDAVERITPTFIAHPRLWLRSLAKAGITDLVKATPNEILPKAPLLLKLYAEMGGQLQKSSMQDFGSIAEKTAAGIADQFDKAAGGGAHKYVAKHAKAGGGFRYEYPEGQAPAGGRKGPAAPAARSRPDEAKKMPTKPQTAAARVMEHLLKMDAKKQRNALANVSYEHLRLVESNAKDEGLKKVVKEVMSQRKAEAARKYKGKKQADSPAMKKSQDGEFEVFCKSYYTEVRDSLMKSHPEWEMGLLTDRTEAQLRQMFKMRG